MSRAMYMVKLQEGLYPGCDERDALEMKEAQDCDFVVQKLLDEEQTMKLFSVARSMYVSEKFEFAEVRIVLMALAENWGYKREAEEIADTICNWCERFEGWDDEEWSDWLTRNN